MSRRLRGVQVALIVASAMAIVSVGCGSDPSHTEPDGATPPPSDSGSNTFDGATEASIPIADAFPDATVGPWTPLPPLVRGPRQETGVAAIDGKIYVIGGFDQAGVVVNIVEAYDAAARTWSDVAPFPRPLHHANTAAVGGKIYVVGGLADSSFRATGDVYTYDPKANAWSAKTSLPVGQERGAGGVAVIGTKIYVAGGFRSGNCVADFTSYDTASDTHATLPNLPQAADHLVAGAVGGIVYAIGGRSAVITALLGGVSAFDPATNTWSPRAPMITPRGGAAAAVVRDRVVVAGGEGNAAATTGVFPQVELYIPASDSWVSLPNMRTPRHGTGGAAIGNTFYVPGGAIRQSFAAAPDVESIDL